MDGHALQIQSWDADASAGASGHLTIDLAALQRNYRKLSAAVAPATAAAVVKADAYGLGAEQVSKALHAQGCRHFFVAHLLEAIKLRPLLPNDTQILVLNGLQSGAEVTCADAGVIPVLNSLEQFRRWSSAGQKLGRVLPAVLQFDTGMSRLGVPLEERSALAAELKGCGSIEILFIMSHLACSDEADNRQNADQLAEMRLIAAEYAELDVCFANSGGVFLGGDYHGVLARPGIALYGGAPTAGTPNPMEPVVWLDVAVIQTRTVPAGTRVGYGGAHVTSAETRLAIIAAGYADGLLRSLSDRGAVFYDGVRLPIVGRVSMDSITVDITTLPEGTLSLGSLVEVLGPHQSLEDVAKAAGTISYEILTSLGRRYERRYR
ncbi:alanine racemase [Sinorhizobium fredii USDA 205]|uniref:Alanine racemase n=2 Tax=Rhizobium fredii TaxID=380 RepID=A0A844AJX4_RHIFR|nr:alanine racemase [Sinorhizobium fredii]AWM26482.1 Alanine racemase [Sinorhizobium fredii CCBAU 25509]KSV80797.1 alanine racemase [Sinorhizobium fredii USDA 205]MQW96987.1 alanine racemase [Sinorhizobium fredii]MQX11610.1 alanine racemase [Sinorhizobium fredii]CCF01019.1 alanine racemase [Sinorhizobium fredii HH103]